MQTMTSLEAGQRAPDFKPKGSAGEPVTLSEHLGQAHVVRCFHPLAFSRVCSHHLPRVQAVLPRIQALGAVVYGISVDSHHANAEFARKLKLGLPLLSDFRREASAAYGVLIPEAGYSGRTAFVVDRQGRAAYKDVSPTPCRIPDTEQIVKALEALA